MIVVPLAPFGAEIRELPIDAPGAALADRLRSLAARFRVLALRSMAIDDAAMLQWVAALGEPMFTEGETPVEGAAMLNIVSNRGRTTPPRSVFHTDSSYLPMPPALTLLRPVVLPTSGGETLFTDQVAVAAALPDRCRAALIGRTVEHGVTGLAGRTDAVRHPLLRRHPLTGETAIYLSTPERCRNLSGIDAETGARTIAALYRWSIRPARLYRHQWRPGDLLIWDNRVTMHRAEHGDVEGDRVLHRGLVRGEAPIAA